MKIGKIKLNVNTREYTQVKKKHEWTNDIQDSEIQSWSSMSIR